MGMGLLLKCRDGVHRNYDPDPSEDGRRCSAIYPNCIRHYIYPFERELHVALRSKPAGTFGFAQTSHRENMKDFHGLKVGGDPCIRFEWVGRNGHRHKRYLTMKSISVFNTKEAFFQKLIESGYPIKPELMMDRAANYRDVDPADWGVE